MKVTAVWIVAEIYRELEGNCGAYLQCGNDRRRRQCPRDFSKLFI